MAKITKSRMTTFKFVTDVQTEQRFDVGNNQLQSVGVGWIENKVYEIVILFILLFSVFNIYSIFLQKLVCTSYLAFDFCFIYPRSEDYHWTRNTFGRLDFTILHTFWDRFTQKKVDSLLQTSYNQATIPWLLPVNQYQLFCKYQII